MKNIKTIVLSLILAGAMSVMADPKPVTLGWIPWIGGGVGSLLGGIGQLGVGLASWGAKTVNDTTYTFSGGLCGKDTFLSKLVARGLIYWGATGLIKQALRYQRIIKSVEDDFKKGLKDPVTGLRDQSTAYWTNESVNTSNAEQALKTLETIKQHFIFKPLAYTGLANKIADLMNHDSLKNEYDEAKYIESLNNATVAYASNKLTWFFGLNEVKDQVISLYVRICLCERAVQKKLMTEDILKKLKLKEDLGTSLDV